MSHFIEVHVNTVEGVIWENKVIIWGLPKCSKQEFEVLLANENDIITVEMLSKEPEMNTLLQHDKLHCTQPVLGVFQV